MAEQNCKGCKREFSKDANVILYICRKCKRIHSIGGDADYYERKVNKIRVWEDIACTLKKI